MPMAAHHRMDDIHKTHLTGLAINSFKRQGRLIEGTLNLDISWKCFSEHEDTPAYKESIPHYHYDFTAEVDLDG